MLFSIKKRHRRVARRSRDRAQVQERDSETGADTAPGHAAAEPSGWLIVESQFQGGRRSRSTGDLPHQPFDNVAEVEGGAALLAARLQLDDRAVSMADRPVSAVNC